jgi:RNA-directed DNA polymerase
LVAWDRVKGNKGARTAGVDGRTASSIALPARAGSFLGTLRSSLRDRSFRPLPVRGRMIPKAGGKLRRLGTATIADRVVPASLKLVLEPIFEADFLPCSYGFRPNRRPQDAVAEVRFLRRARMSGASRATSKPVSTKSRIRPSRTRCESASEINAS